MATKAEKILVLLTVGLFLAGSAFAADQSKPNIVVIWGDDIGESNISAYTFGLKIGRAHV